MFVLLETDMGHSVFEGRPKLVKSRQSRPRIILNFSRFNFYEQFPFFFTIFRDKKKCRWVKKKKHGELEVERDIGNTMGNIYDGHANRMRCFGEISIVTQTIEGTTEFRSSNHR